MQQAGSIVALGLGWREAAVAIAVGNIIITGPVTFNGAIGSRHNIPISIASRAAMGFYFSYFGIVSRLVLVLLWLGGDQQQADCVLRVLGAPVSPVTDHPRKMRWLFFIKSICVIVAAFALLGWAMWIGGPGPNFSQPSKLKGRVKSWGHLSAINVAVSDKTTLVINMPDLTRYAKRPFGGLLADSWTSRAAAFFRTLVFGLATLNANISANSVAASNDLAFLAQRG
ncbi:hypothetical protein DL768_001447 [Monosporascus sp. mg162]|nr:hypothetical protein DL768_001447 [Monosporascus sp. mg162]